MVIGKLQEISYGWRGDKRYEYFNALKRNLTVSRDELIDIQNMSIQKLLHHAYFSTEYYRKIFDDLGLRPEDIREGKDLLKLPLLGKSLVKDNLHRLKSNDAFSENLFSVTSGGSTGNQALIYKSPFFEQMSRASTLRNNMIAGWNPADRVVWIWGAPYEHEQAKGSIKAKIGIAINKRLLLNAYNYAKKDFSAWVGKIQKFKPKIVYGYSSIIAEFSRYLLENNIRLDSVKSVVSTTEALTERSLIKSAFGCKVFDQYGSREILSIAIESDEGIMRVSDDTVVLNISENGEFIVTALHSYGFPLINYKIGDYGTVIDSVAVHDNLPFSCVSLTIGRITDNFINKQQRKISSSALSTYIASFNIPLREQQIIQADYTMFIVNYVPANGFDFGHYSGVVMKALEEYFGEDVNVQFNAVEKIPVEKSGKKLMFKRTFELEK
ncbi:MAG: phenylacetate-CoA [Desulfobulbaceae bacterium]|nr:MAG: phenylacetate-CoA [Desulfobulbaceae bacterium]